MANNGTTWLTFVNDVSKILKQNYASAEINQNAILFWALTGASRLRKSRFTNNIKATGTIEGDYLAIFDDIPVQTYSAGTDKSKIKNQKFIEFPRKIVDLDFDAGLHLLTYSTDTICDVPEYANVKFHRTTPAKVYNYYANPLEKPSTTNPYYFRDNMSLIWLLGLEEVSIKSLMAFVYLNPTIDEIDDTNIDTPMNLPEDLIAILRADIVNMGKFALMLPRDRMNDGNINTLPIPGGAPVQSISQEQQEA